MKEICPPDRARANYTKAIPSTDCGRGSTATHRFTAWFNLIRAHPTAPVLTNTSTACGRGSTATHRFTAWFMVHYRCCRFPRNRLGSVRYRGALSYWRWLPSLSCGKVARVIGPLPLLSISQKSIGLRGVSGCPQLLEVAS